ncbi:MAG: Dihydrolipoyl dehydrogenase 3 [Alphaproteobacteria bacterium MarineAlpha9_Bin3]|nr:MAG: Dihydrolipoyl dehydrogenase 3 [Alphaproteobacteria bacterium MarineAlpha9_Bin3]|tara:strand:+ start:42497 stop:43897 length:1401 start_codon:yes stop_codon:yes gene_type:complete
MAENKSYDVIIIGSGPGGYVAAIRASQLGLKAAVIEKDKLGGICLNWGCIPTKALLRASEINHILSEINDFGINLKSVNIDWKKLVLRSREVSDQLSKGVDYLLKKNNVDIMYGEGKIAGKGRVTVKNMDGESLYTASNIILATGARPKNIEGLKHDGKFIWSYKEAMIPKEKPESILIVGAGAIGIEFASFYSDFGTEVTVIESQDRILPAEDKEISEFAKKSLLASKINILNSAIINKIKSTKEGVLADFLDENGNKHLKKYSKAIMAIGIDANIENIGIETVNIKIENGKILTDNFNQTSEKGIFAIGDLTGAPWLAHKASHEAVNAVNFIHNPKIKAKHNKIIPGCTYSRPQIASIGVTEEQAIEKKIKIKVGKFPLLGNGKAIALGNSDGFIKTIFNFDTGELIGAHMIGPEVTELISTYCVAMQLEATELDLFNTIFPHPTVSESIHESVLDAYDRALHI